MRLGAVGAAEVAADDNVILVLAPQSMVGASIYEPLSEMAEVATSQGTSVVLINPILADKQSSSGVRLPHAGMRVSMTAWACTGPNTRSIGIVVCRL